MNLKRDNAARAEHETVVEQPSRRKTVLSLGVTALLTAVMVLLLEHLLLRGRNATMDAANDDGAGDHVDFEKSDLSLGGVARLGLAFVAALVLVLIVTSLLQSSFTGQSLKLNAPAPSLSVPPNVTLPPEPRLQPNPEQDLEEFRANEDAVLHSYGWVDQQKGVVRIPIERAMDLLLQRGLPTRPQDAATQFKDEGNALPEPSSSGRMIEQVSP